jgi:uncharacterized protein (TIRG00374 family)
MTIVSQPIRKLSVTQTMSNKKRWIAVLGLLISGVFLWIAFRNLKPEAVVTNIQQANIAWLLVGGGVYFLAVTVISLRWRFLLRAIKTIPLPPLISLVAIGYMGNNVYPFRSGEVLRIMLLQRNHGVPFTKATTTVIVERVFDGLVMLTFILLSLLTLDISSPEVRRVAMFAAPLFLTALVLFLVLAARPNILRRLRDVADKILPEPLRKPLSGMVEDVLSGLEGLRSPADLAGTVISSYVSWGIEAFVYWLVSFAFNLNVGYPVMLLAVGVVNLAGLIPASPGQIGVFEFFVGTVLAAVGVEEVTATAYALVVHVVIWLPVTLVGFYLLTRQGLNWEAVTHARELEQPAG